MRHAFLHALCDVAAADDRIWLLSGDLGFSVLEPFINRFPKRFINTGVAEQNMTGVAAGLALAGKIVFTYSIANFPVVRCLEQIRNDVCHHRLNVKVVSVGAGFAYGSAGYSHHGLEDLAIMRVLPHMTIFTPADPIETVYSTRSAASLSGPCYLRLEKGGEKMIHPASTVLDVGMPLRLREGSDVTLVACGSCVQLALAAADELRTNSIAADVYSIPTFTPLDGRNIRESASRTGHVVTIEEHGPGGLASVVCELFVSLGMRVKLRPIYVSRAVDYAGSQTVLRESTGLSVPAIAAAASELIGV